MALRYESLLEAVKGGGVGIRSRTELEPLGGAGDKVFPATYGVDKSALTKYATEPRVVTAEDGSTTKTESVVLDSVSSQANRLEMALLEAVRAGDLSLPVTSVDFSAAGLPGLDRISDYEAPHRIFDALLRDSFDGDVLFRQGATGQSITEAAPRDAAALFHHSPHTLVFGGWDSTGPRGGRGAKYERAITSEIVAHGIEIGKKTSSRIDPAGIEMKAGPLYEAKDGIEWTVDPTEAVLEKGKPKLFAGGGEGPPGRPSQVNHGNVTPSIDGKAGGVTAERIVGITVLSLIQLRRLRFPALVDGSAVPSDRRSGLEAAARAALAALGLAATVLAFEDGFDLRSRCVLVATGPLRFELVGRAGTRDEFEIDGRGALDLLSTASAKAADAGIPWRADELLLRPSDRLVNIIRRSQAVAAAGEAEDT
jgi:CRISPR-associated protein Csb1